MAYADIYRIYKKKERIMGLTESEAMEMAKIKVILYNLLERLELAVVEGIATAEEIMQVDNLRNLLFAKAIVR